MDFNLINLTEQTHKLSKLLFDIVLEIFIFISLFPGLDYPKFLSFIANQCYRKGEMQSGNISIIFIGILIVGTLIENIGEKLDNVIPPYSKINYKNLNLLITRRFYEFALIVKEEQKDFFSADLGIRQTMRKAFSVTDPTSNDRKWIISMRKNAAPFLVASGIIKLGIGGAIILALINLFEFNLLMAIYNALLIIIFFLMWYVANYLFFSKIWYLLDKYLSLQKKLNISGDVLMTHERKKYFTKYRDKVNSLSNRQQMYFDIKKSFVIFLKFK